MGVDKELINTGFVDLPSLPLIKPIPLIFHGTDYKNIDSILENGLQPLNDDKVYLSSFFGKALGYGLFHNDSKKFALLTIDFDYIKNQTNKENTILFNPFKETSNDNDWQSWFIIKVDKVPKDKIKEIYWSNTYYFNSQRGKALKYYGYY